MSNLYLKKPLYKSLSEFTDLSIQNYDTLKAKVIPVRVESVTGAFVTVSVQVASESPYPLIEMPVIGSEFIQMPITVGTTGIAIPADYSIGGITGLGLGVASDLQPPNLSAMVFVPISNTSYPATLPGVTTLSGPVGVALKDATGASSFEITSAGITFNLGTSSVTIAPASITIVSGATIIEITSASIIFTLGTSTITITPASITIASGSMTIELSSSGVVINGINFSTHTHSVTTAPGTTGVPA